MARSNDDLHVPPEFPAWLSHFVAADWTDETDARSELMDWNTPERARAVLAQGRWSAARRAYAAEHGITVWDLPRASDRQRREPDA